MGLSVYFYVFQHAPTLLAHVRPDFVRADHGDELILVLGGPFLRKGPATPEEKVLSKKVMKYLANFARTGDPNGLDLTSWPQYSTEEFCLGIGVKRILFTKLKEKKCKFWAEILPRKIQSKTAVEETTQS